MLLTHTMLWGISWGLEGNSGLGCWLESRCSTLGKSRVLSVHPPCSVGSVASCV